MTFSELIDKWRDSQGAERANKDAFLVDLCHALGVEPPHPARDPDEDTYVFEYPVRLAKESGGHTVGFVDLYKKHHFLLEAKQGSEQGSSRLGTARRNTPAWNIAMRVAYGQALGYARTLDEPPPFLIVTDIGYCFDLYASFDGSGDYRPFPRATDSRFYLQSLETHAGLFRTIFTDPHALDPSKEAARVTRNIASHVARLARTLEETGHDSELVAKFLMRCLFTMFAEDVELLPDDSFRKGLERWYDDPRQFVPELEHLWKTMDAGGTLYGVGHVWKFNGGLFADCTALPLRDREIAVLLEAAEADWSEVEPAIFGTLLERALDPKERHRLGAHYTPRAYVERLVGPTIEEPLREEWDLVQAEVRNIIEKGKADDDRKAMVEARKPVYAFFDKLCNLRVLDPACGSGNFLFVALDLFKRLENEILDLLHDLGDEALFLQHGRMVTPEQFLGIEIKPWAKEIAELVLWIGWLQWQIRTRGWKTNPQEPILRDYHNIECRDAVLAYDTIEPLLDDDGTPVTRWDGETMKISPVTGEEIPDETARTPVYRYVNPRKAEWPEAEFIVGNPPFIGNKRMQTRTWRRVRRGTSDCLIRSLPRPQTSLMYWWYHAQNGAGRKQPQRFGLITTNSIGQPFQSKSVR